MKLYYKAGSCSLSPHIALREAGIDFTLEAVDLATKKTESGEDFLAINPKGQVPALLLDNGYLLTEGVAIVQYIADQKKDRQLLPELNSLKRYEAIGWLNFVSTEMHKGFGPLYNPKTPEEYREIAKANLMQKLAMLDKHFASNEYLLGANYSCADGYLFTVINWTFFLQMDISHLENVKKYMKRVGNRPAVLSALAAEGLQLNW
ncbi:glutathione transferase GstA [Thorsellia anophelis]|uniref:Glutathione S-transferase n=1 Tax=Thorsellia anophelis DSM 18579 TaxID=1123402 RepID=A0A1I0BQ66_9GAMM|nr:glutathione transferase GstA [Thorsellia anophelis]SET09223.1 glutathione S-transferase [Thorsellia anophelis DSM 18579]